MQCSSIVGSLNSLIIFLFGSPPASSLLYDRSFPWLRKPTCVGGRSICHHHHPIHHHHPHFLSLLSHPPYFFPISFDFFFRPLIAPLLISIPRYLFILRWIFDHFIRCSCICLLASLLSPILRADKAVAGLAGITAISVSSSYSDSSRDLARSNTTSSAFFLLTTKHLSFWVILRYHAIQQAKNTPKCKKMSQICNNCILGIDIAIALFTMVLNISVFGVVAI